jgi:hypothetical protein
LLIFTNNKKIPLFLFFTEMSSIERFTAVMVLAGVGDCLEYNNGHWENGNVDRIIRELKELGGIDKV